MKMVFTLLLFTMGSGLLPQRNFALQNKFSISFQTSNGISGCNIQLKSPDAQEREEMFGGIVRNEKSFNNHDVEFKTHEKEIAFRELKEGGWLQLGAPDDALFQNFVDSIQLTNIGKLYEVRKSIEQNDLVLAESKNSAIVSTHIIEENQKTVNQIYLQKATSKQMDPISIGFDATETAILESIACQDPLEGGEAVYSARVMLRKNDICQSSAKMAFVNNDVEEESKSILQNQKVYSLGKIYPNPNDGNMQLDYQLEIGQIGVLIIYDILGQKVKNYSLENDRTILKIGDAALKNGIYFYEILVNDAIIRSEKLIIIR